MSEDFGTITILAPKCQKCLKVNSCDHKQNGSSRIYHPNVGK